MRRRWGGDARQEVVEEKGKRSREKQKNRKMEFMQAITFRTPCKTGYTQEQS